MADFNIDTINYDRLIKGFSHSAQEGKAGTTKVSYASGQVEEVQATVFIDRNFQRLFCWNRQRRRAFLKALMQKKSGQCLHIACISSCLDHSRKVGDEYSIARFEQLLKWGYKYISLDGQNRTLTAQEFCEVDSTLTSENVDHVCLAARTTVNLNNKLLKDFPPNVKAHFLSATKIPVNIYTGYTYSELAKEFRDLNSSEQLNPMETRNSYQSFIAKWVRERAGVHKQFFERYTQKSKRESFFLRMNDRRFLSIFCLFLGGVFKDSIEKPFEANNVNCMRESNLDQMFAIGDSIPRGHTGFPYCTKKLARIDEIVSMLNVGSPYIRKLSGGKAIPNWQVWAALASYEWVYDNGYHVQTADQECFVEMIFDFITRERRDSKLKWSQANSTLDGQAEEPKRNYFFGQLEIIGEPKCREEFKIAIGRLMSQHASNLPMIKSLQKAA